MPGPYVRDAHYMYGNGMLQPYPAYFNASWMHRKPPIRDLFSLMEFFDDGSIYVACNKPASVNTPVTRGSIQANVINIETLAFRTLRLKLYRFKEEDDTDILLELGKRYSVTYITEGGLQVATGILKVIDPSIPDTCTRYVGEFNETVATAWIGLDCSTVGNSDKRKLFVASIRAIEEAPIDDPNYVPPVLDGDELTDSQKLQKLYENLGIFDNKLNQILAKVADNDEIMSKLDEIDPAEKLEMILQLISSKTDEIKSNTDSKAGLVMTKINETHGEAMAALERLINKLGEMPYDDKINYIYSKIMDMNGETINPDGSTPRPMSEVVVSTESKVDQIIQAIENGVQITFL